MSSLKEQLIALAKEKGATAARITTKERMADGPPSADPTYVLPEARSVIAFAAALDRSFIPEHFGKVSRMGFKRAMYDTYQLLGSIGEDLVACLQAKGHQAAYLSPNAYYRPGSTPNLLIPRFSHRYAALASGLATLGWSGNVLMPEHRAAAFYCSAVTDAELEPDEPLTEEICDKCKLCTLVCPNQFISPGETQTYSLAGREYTCSKRRAHMLCGISCAGLTGLSRDGKWSTWSTGRYELPESDDRLPELYVRALNDPDMAHIRSNVVVEGGNGPRGILARSLEDTNPTCCNCLLVCSGPREWRRKLVDLLHSSGHVVWQNGREVVINPNAERSRAIVEEMKAELARL